MTRARNHRITLAALPLTLLCLAALLIPAQAARANHQTCNAWAYPPVNIAGTGEGLINFKVRTECAPQTVGRVYDYAQKHRWYGWSTIASKDEALYWNTGDRSLNVTIQCHAGTWTYRTFNSTWLNHLGGGPSYLEAWTNGMTRTC